RSSFFAGENENDSTTFIEKLIRYGNKIQTESQSMQQSLFGDLGSGAAVKKPAIPEVEEWPQLILLEKEKNLIGIYLTAHPLDDYKVEIQNFCSRDVSLTDLKNDIEKFKDRDFTFGGMVTAAREGTSKNGNPFSTLTLSDYTDSYEFFFFGQDYVNFHKYCKTGLFILLKGTVKQRFKSDFYEFKASQIELLSEARKNYVKSVTINIPLNKVNESVIEQIESIVRNNKGKALLKFNVYDPESNMFIHLFSRNTRIELTNSLLEYFEKETDIGYRIN
ncbi:OB-fold nucleic acid binding domain-containing protein, partial [Mariniphaga sediminis]